MELIINSTDTRYPCEQIVILNIFDDIYIDCTYIYPSDWSGSCSEEGPVFEGAPPRFLYMTP